MELKKEQLQERFQIKKRIVELQLKEVEGQVQEEEQALDLIRVCIESVRRKNDQLKHTSSASHISQQQNAASASKYDFYDQSYPPEEQQFAYHTDENINQPQELSYDRNYQQYHQTPPPWFRMVKRRKVIDEITTSNREYKTATDILVEQEQHEEWTEVRYDNN
jgi:hypothetical protein